MGNPEAVSAASNISVHLYDTFIFDLDGTLLDTLPDLVVLTNRALEETGFPTHTEAEILSYVGSGARALINLAVPQGATDEGKELALARWKALYPEYGYTYTKPIAGIPEVLASLKARGANLGTLSNKFDAATCEVIARYLPRTFDVVHGECEDIPRKPDPTGLLRTIRELGSIPERTVYVGDSAGDIKAAHNAGCFGLGVTWGYNSAESLREAGADALIDTPSQMLGLMA